MRESTRRLVARTPAPDVNSWEYDHELCLLSGLLEARRNGRFNASADAYGREELQSLLMLLTTRHEGYAWELRSVENKCKDLKDFWSAFKEAKDATRARFNAKSGELDMDMRKEALLMDKRHPHIFRIAIAGLTVDDEITYEAWEEIFSKDQPIAARTMDRVAGTKGDASTMRVGSPKDTSTTGSPDEDIAALSPESRPKVPSSTASNIIKARKQKAKKRGERRRESTKSWLQ